MAEHKKTKKQIADVARPGKTPPPPNSKSVIITHRPMMADPMMVSAPPEDTETPSAPPLPTKGSSKPKLQPLSAAETKKVSPVEQASAPKLEVPLTIVPTEQPKDPAPEAGSEKSADNETETVETQPIEPEKTETAANPPLETKEEASKPDEREPKLEQPEANSTSVKDGNPDETEAAAQAEHEVELQKIVDSKQYFLPINSLEKRRSRRFVLLGVVLSVVLLVAWADIALDASLITIPGIKPVTHFFSN